MDMGMSVDVQPQISLPVNNRPKGRYSLTDFNIHRTLGTGSFGRVHLGELSWDIDGCMRCEADADDSAE